jgi:hypothetical protein
MTTFAPTFRGHVRSIFCGLGVLEAQVFERAPSRSGDCPWAVRVVDWDTGGLYGDTQPDITYHESEHEAILAACDRVGLDVR